MITDPYQPAAAARTMPAPADRKVELDWLRAGMVALVFVFHTSRFFDPWPWHVKNPAAHAWLGGPMAVFIGVAMPLLFVISGMSVRLALRRRSAGRFVHDRLLRLFVPLAAGTLTHVMYQVYLERKSQAGFEGSFLEFVPRYFDGWYGFGRGNFAWMGLHLWYLELLLVFSLALLPLFLWLRSPRGERALDALCRPLARPGAVYLLAVPVALALVLPRSTSPLGARWWGGWNVLAHAVFFLAGSLLVARDAVYDQVRRLWPLSTVLSLAVTILVLVAAPAGREPAHLGLEAWTVLGGMAVASWFGVLAIVGAGIEYLRPVQARFLGRLNEGVLPFYVVHQSVIIAVGWPVVRLPIPDLVKWVVIFAVSLAITLASVALLVRPFAPMRVLFGMQRRTPEET